MIKSPITWLISFLGAICLSSCKEKAPQQIKTEEEIAREAHLDALVQNGKRYMAIFEDLRPIFAEVQDMRSLKKAERDLVSLEKTLKSINREIRLLDKPDRLLKNKVHEKLTKDKEVMKIHIIAAMKEAENVPPDLFVRANQALSNFLNGDHGLGQIIDDYYKPSYAGEPAPDPKLAAERKKIIELAAKRLEQKKAAEEIPETPARLPAQVVPEEDGEVLELIPEE